MSLLLDQSLRGFDRGRWLVLEELRPDPRRGIAVFGCGTIGLGAVSAAAEIGCHPIFIIDDCSQRLLAARRLGGTHAIDPLTDEPAAAIHSVLASGVRYAVDTASASMIADCLTRFATVARPHHVRDARDACVVHRKSRSNSVTTSAHASAA